MRFTAWVGIPGLLVGLGLAATVRAQEPAQPVGAAVKGARATLLSAPTPVARPGAGAGDPMPASPASLDPSVLATKLQTSAGLQDQEASPAADASLPDAEPLPKVAQAGAGPGGQAPGTPGLRGRAQPGATTRPAPPDARQPAPPPGRTPPARTGQPPTNRPAAADVNQQVQFDQAGLITMHTNELDVRQLLELLSRRSGMNILVSPKVTGTITANFEGVTVDKVLDVIIKLAGLVDKKEGTIHYIFTKEEVQDDAEFTKKERILTKVYKLNYVRADEILGVIRPFLSQDVGQRRISVTPSYRFGISEAATFVSGGGQQMSAGGGGGGGGGVAAAGGTGGPGGAPPTGGGPTIGGFQPPTGGNSLADYDHLIIQDYESNLQIIDQIIERIDVRPVQVLIEAVIISVDYEHDRELGVNLGLVDNLGQALGTIGSGTSLNGNVGFTPSQLLTTGGKIAQGTVTDGQGFTSATNGIKFGFVSNNVTGFIRALETIGSTKILASPRILVLNKQRAEIQLGTRLGFQTLSQNFTSTIQQVQFLNTGTLLRLRPFVSNDGMVRMEIHPERSSGTVTNNIPNQNTAELTTNVMVPDGSTLVIGGLIEDEDDYNYQGLPILSRIPALGFLTGINQKLEGRRELVVLLTPHIWSGEQAMTHAPAVPPHPMGAFGAEGPVAGTSTTFDLETGRPAANSPVAPGHAPAGGTGPNPGSAAAMPGAADPRLTRTAGVAATGAADPSHASMLASAAPAGASCVPGSSPADAASRDADASPRRRRTPIRDWFARRSRDRQPDPSRIPESRPQGTMGSPGDGSPTQTAPATAPAPAVEAAQQPAAIAAPPVDPGGSEPAASDQHQPTAEPGGNGQELQPSLPVPVGDARSPQMPLRDPMIGQASWSRSSEMRLPVEAEPTRRLVARAPENRDKSPAGRPRGVAAGPRRHTIEAGESFGSIARLYYGSEDLADPLREYNRGRIARGGPRPGDLLVIPPREELSPVGGWVIQARSRPSMVLKPFATAPSGPDRSGARAESRPRPVYHVVSPGETPRSIARDRLGDAARAAEIVDLNHNLLTTEGRWRPGLRLLLPPDAAPPRDNP